MDNSHFHQEQHVPFALGPGADSSNSSWSWAPGPQHPHPAQPRQLQPDQHGYLVDLEQFKMMKPAMKGHGHKSMLGPPGLHLGQPVGVAYTGIDLQNEVSPDAATVPNPRFSPASSMVHMRGMVGRPDFLTHDGDPELVVNPDDPIDMQRALDGMDFSFLGDYAESALQDTKAQQGQAVMRMGVGGQGYMMKPSPFVSPFPGYDSPFQQGIAPMGVHIAGTGGGGPQWTPVVGQGQPLAAPRELGDAAERPSPVVDLAPSKGRSQIQFPQCRWHESASVVGQISGDGHIFTKKAGPRQSRVSDKGRVYELATICMVFDASLRSGGVHRYQFYVLGGELGPADGAGFTFDTKVRRKSIQQMCAVFLNQRGCICLRRRQQVTKLPARLPPLTVGVLLTMIIDLNMYTARFELSKNGTSIGSADVSVGDLVDTMVASESLRSGFFCAVVTGNISVGLY